ncbi:hypothetical protein CAPTEDRAFT_201684 [Capitella teleta]|uniref:Uncharacterized protein n=1 Tax=Capitella teleta TaxID=283909 RepID=R7T4S9_CAPTE|nr:hypothetical protein CAPTEDRAFT_201684 [Capitella teleta]|eukprot:ELT87973.1 hypothetical protein CAPTEDRAFT_201684 [Capitella teleta]
MKPGVHAAELPLTLREQIDKGPHSSDVTCVDQLQLRRYLDFGGWSKHMPVQKDDKKLQRNRQIRHNINEDNAQHSRDSAGYLTGLSLKPKLPATCSCDILCVCDCHFLLTDNLEWTQQRQRYWSIYSMILMMLRTYGAKAVQTWQLLRMISLCSVVMPCDREEEITTAFII